MGDEYDAAAARWANGMRNAKPLIDQRREAQRAVATANRANAKRCGVKGCTRSGGKRGICAKHWSQVPLQERLYVVLRPMEAQMKAAAKEHRRILRLLNSGTISTDA